ncbi:MAG: BatA domain-containing protein [Bacteroidia bacterium]|nr:BatA domain-containing protein [Bacteroidia bacterium]
MSFLYPTFLFATGLIAIPIIIHFFHFRRYKTIYFSSLQFLFNVAKETRSRNRLKHLLVLLARILTIICLVFAFSQPFIPAKNQTSKTNSPAVAIYIDNSFSMNADGTNGNLIEEAKNKALEIISVYPASTNFALITNDLEPKHQHILNSDQLIDYISAIRTSPRSIKLSDIILRAKDIAKTNNEYNPVNFCLISDFQKYFIDPENINADSSLSLMLFPSIPLPAKNISIDSCWFEYPEHNINQQEKLQVKIVNHSRDSYQNIPVKLFVNDSIKTMSNFSIAGNSSETITLAYSNITKGIIRGKIELTDYPITYDNSYFFNYDVTNKINILAINGDIQSKYFYNLFKDDSLFSFTEMAEKNINFQIFQSNQVIILNGLKNISSGLHQELNSFSEKGGSIVFIPQITNTTNYNTFLTSYGINTGISDSTKSQIASINDKSPFFKNVFQKIEDNPQLPTISKSLVFKASGKNRFDELLISRNGYPLLLSTEQNKGKIYAFSFPFDDKSTNFTVHPLFVPIFYRICSLSKITPEICYEISPEVSVSVQNSIGETENVIEIKNQKSGESFIPSQIKGNSEITLLPGNQVNYDGFYDIVLKGNVFNTVSFNYNRKESLADYFSPEEIKNSFEEKGIKTELFNSNNNETLSNQLKQNEQGKPLWKYFILLTLFFIAAEIALIRLLKN